MGETRKDATVWTHLRAISLISMSLATQIAGCWLGAFKGEYAAGTFWLVFALGCDFALDRLEKRYDI